MSNLLLRVIGTVTVAILGRRDKYSEKHQQFLCSGYVCPQCGKTLMSRTGVADVNCYSLHGEQISIDESRSKGASFGCPKCGYQWRISDES
jgi:predicted RNA-binding Zn-ribbon protein involved in translation (DUF1610 family)